MLSWNINGWTDQNKNVRTNIIQALDCDIVCLCETHLKGDSELLIQGYKTFTHNRSEQHIRAKKNYGGIAILCKQSVFDNYKVEVVDKEYDGILMINLVDKISGYDILFIGLYLPPENSPWGRDSVSVFAHILSCLYQFEDADAIYLCGDMNVRTGNRVDYIQEIDNVATQVALD